MYGVIWQPAGTLPWNEKNIFNTKGGGGKKDVRHLPCCLGLETDAIVNAEVLMVVNEYSYL